jgi:hypothetical protein
MKRCLSLLLAAACLPAGHAGATLIASESFLTGSPANPAAGEYSVGAIDPFGAGPAQNPTVFGFTGAWKVLGNAGEEPISGTGLWTIESAGLSHPEQLSAGGAARHIRNDSEVTTPRTAYRNLASPPVVNAGDAMYMSAMLRLDANDPDFDGLMLGGFVEGPKIADPDIDGWRVGFKGDGSEMDLIFRSRTRLAPPGGPVTQNDVVLDNGVNLGDTYLVVIKGEKDVVGGGGFPNDRISIWVNPLDTRTEVLAGAPTVVIDFSLFNNSFNVLALQGINVTGNGALFDEFRLGTTWRDVVAPAGIPEPASLSLLLTAAGATLARRRR